MREGVLTTKLIMRLRAMSLLTAILVVVCAQAKAQPVDRDPTALNIDELAERIELSKGETKYELKLQLVKEILAANPNQLDGHVVEEVFALLGQSGGPDSELALAMAHIGPRAIQKLIELIAATSNELVQWHLSEQLKFTVRNTEKGSIESATIDQLAGLLDIDQLGVAINAAEGLGEIGAPASRAIPELERVQQRSIDYEDKISREYGSLSGVRGSDVVGRAIAKIKGVPYHRN